MMEREEQVFAALADGTRRKLLINLAENSPKTATQLAQEFPITRQGILKHLDILEAAGLVQVQPKGREKRYALTLEPLENVSDWIASIGKRWEGRLQHLKAMLENNDIIDSD